MKQKKDKTLSPASVKEREMTSLGEDLEAKARCVVFADLRGDFRLLFTLLTQITGVAQMDDRGGWQWKTTDTTLVCLGNFVDRFGQKGFNRLTVDTASAIEQETRIIRTFQALAEAAETDRKGNAVVVLMGDHEMGNLLNWEDYQIYQMADPSNEEEQEMRENFIQNVLKPFCLKQGLVARWGTEGATVYLSHAGLDLKWFKQFKPRTIPELNRDWQRWMRSNNFVRLKYFRQGNSPVLSDRMALQPQLWREQDEETFLRVLGKDPNPKYVQAGLPVQMIREQTWDPFMRPPRCADVDQNATMLCSRAPDGEDQMYFIHNAMADVFCVYDDTDRQPQALEIVMHVNGMSQSLYLSCRTMTMAPDEYRVYLDERPVGSCQRPLTTESKFLEGRMDLELSPEELSALNPGLTEDLDTHMREQTSHVKDVALILFSDDMKKVFLLQERRSNKWALPSSGVKTGEPVWQALQNRVINKYIGMKGLSFLPGGSMVDIDVSTSPADRISKSGGDGEADQLNHSYTRVWMKRTIQAMTFRASQEYRQGQWFHFDTLQDVVLQRSTKFVFCVLMRDNLLWVTSGFRQCPEWITQQHSDRDRHAHPGLPWWEKDLLGQHAFAEQVDREQKQPRRRTALVVFREDGVTGEEGVMLMQVEGSDEWKLPWTTATEGVRSWQDILQQRGLTWKGLVRTRARSLNYDHQTQVVMVNLADVSLSMTSGRSPSVERARMVRWFSWPNGPWPHPMKDRTKDVLSVVKNRK